MSEPVFSIYGEIELKGKDDVIESLKAIDEEAASTAESLESSLGSTSTSADSLSGSLGEVSKASEEASESASSLQSSFSTAQVEKFGDTAVRKMEEIEEAVEAAFSSSESSLSQFFESLGNAFSTLTDYMDEYITPFFEAIADYQSQELENKIEALEEQLDAMKEAYEEELEEYEEKVEEEKALLNQQYKSGQISYAEYVAACKALNDELSDYEEENTQEQAELEEEIAAEQDKLAKKEFEAEKVNQIAEVWIAAATATIKCFSTLGPIAGAIATALVATTAAIQTATISSQKYTSTYAKGGIVDEPTVGLIGEAGKEAVVPLENNTEWVETLKDILMPAVDESLRTAIETESSAASPMTASQTAASAAQEASEGISQLIDSILSQIPDGLSSDTQAPLSQDDISWISELSDAMNDIGNSQSAVFDTIPPGTSSHTWEQEDRIESKLDEILEILREMTSKAGNENLQVVLDTGVLAGAITNSIDNKLGKTISLRARGVAT